MDATDLQSVFSRCSVIIDSTESLLPPILLDNVNFLMNLLVQDRSRSICYHAGTDFLIITASIIMGIRCLIGDKTTPEEAVRNLDIGNYVIYNGSRGIFSGFDDEGRAIVEQKQSLINFVPASRFHLIKPYHGEATSLSSKGIRDIPAKKRKFLSSILDVSNNDIPQEAAYSVVIITDKNTSDYIMNATMIRSPSGDFSPSKNPVPSSRNGVL